jgi:hypothetical protein
LVRTRIIRSGLAAALVGALTVSGACGGGNARLSARDYVSETSAVCARANRAIERVKVRNLDGSGRMSRETARVLAIHRESADSLRALRPPKDYETTAKMWIALVDQSTDELDSMRTSLEAHDWPAARSYAEKADALDARSQVIAGKYGITPCRVPEFTASKTAPPSSPAA